MGQGHVVLGFQADELGAWNRGGHASALLKRNDIVVSTVQDQSWYRHFRKQVENVDLIAGHAESNGIFRRRRLALHLRQSPGLVG